MHTALSHPRLHQVKTHVVAQYCLEGARYGGPYVRVDNAHGPHFRTMGKGDSKNRIWLPPEERYILSRGAVWISSGRIYQVSAVMVGMTWKGKGMGMAPLGELPMNLEGA
jgi:hypothetical protein